MSYIPSALRRFVTKRADCCCEYCKLPDRVGFYPHELDHVIAKFLLQFNSPERIVERKLIDS